MPFLEDQSPAFASTAARCRATSSSSTAKRGPQWYVKYRLPDGRQILAQARAGTLPGMVRTGAWCV